MEKKKKPFYKRGWFIALVIFVIIGTLGGGDKDAPKEPAKQSIEKVETSKEPEKSTVEKVEEPIKEPIVESTETLSQQNAVKKAKSYLDYTAFSKSGLVEQLEFEGFDNEDAIYAVDQMDTDWKEQAVIKGKQYLDYTAFSRSGLIEQLEFDKFTKEEAVHAVDEIGL